VAQWDAEKAAANLKKHGVDFADAETALHDEMALTRPDDDPDEERFVTWGRMRWGGCSWLCTNGGTTTGG
jgi:uncharacterized DUF497 family protein